MILLWNELVGYALLPVCLAFVVVLIGNQMMLDGGQARSGQCFCTVNESIYLQSILVDPLVSSVKTKIEDSLAVVNSIVTERVGVETLKPRNGDCIVLDGLD
jgi:hypothetical protein